VTIRKATNYLCTWNNKSNNFYYKCFSSLILSAMYICKVVFAALSDELIYPFVKQSICNRNILPKITEFGQTIWKWANKLFWCGIRNWNDELALDPKQKPTALLYSFNNIKYQKSMSDTFYLLTVYTAKTNF